jgi:superoxide dismutase, Fe-Mn family
MAFNLPELPYSYDALEPFYDAKTVEIHHSKHHNAYTVNFNKAVDAAGLGSKSVEDILKSLESAPSEYKTALTNHGGGYWNHSFFWESMAAKAGGEANGPVADAIKSKFGSFDAFKEAFSAKAAGHFGSGWAWLVVNTKGELEVTDTHDQICPLTVGQKPLLTLDVWEHAYYLKYKNVRPDWIAAFWSLVNWKKVNERFELAK